MVNSSRYVNEKARSSQIVKSVITKAHTPAEVAKLYTENLCIFFLFVCLNKVHFMKKKLYDHISMLGRPFIQYVKITQ